MRETFGHLLWESFRRVWGVPAVVLALILTVVFWFYPPATQLPLGPVVIVFICSFIILAVFADLAYRASTRLIRPLPKVVHGRGPIGNEILLCLLEPSELFSYNLAVSFYFIDNSGFERLIGIGGVLNIQEDRRIQVALTDAAAGQDEVLDLLRQNDANVLSRMRIKPSIPHEYFRQVGE
jgi:hypothetical protein